VGGSSFRVSRYPHRRVRRDILVISVMHMPPFSIDLVRFYLLGLSCSFSFLCTQLHSLSRSTSVGTDLWLMGPLRVCIEIY